jgi:uncharacterized protein YlxW (UPF0749 family)
MKMNFYKAVIFIVCIALGLTISMQMREKRTYAELITIANLHQLQNEINSLRSESSFLEVELEDIREKLNRYQTVIDNKDDLYDVILAEYQQTKLILGISDVQGPGIIVTLNDSKSELQDFQNPNELIVHDADILMVLNDIKGAGAEAISLNEQRIMPFSEIVCAGPTIRVNNVRYAPPFVIKAIGNPDTLSAAILAPFSSAKILETLGLDVKIEIVDNLTIHRYNGNLDLKYIKNVGGE